MERATAAAFVNGKRTGSCVLIDRRHALTSQHVVGKRSPAGTEVELLFPAVGASIPAVSVNLGEWAVQMDVALLELSGDVPTGIAVPEWLPYAGAVDRVKLFGYPLAECELNGIWVQAAPAGLTTARLLQLDATGAASSLTGHSGGPVVDSATDAVIGILVEGSEELRFDRALPIELLAQRCPGLVSWWLFAGDNATDHFRRRTMGQRSIVRGWDQFRGRSAALERIRASVTGDAEMPLVVTGQPGAGKSTVLARAALAERERGVSPGLAFHARGQGVSDLVRAVARVVAAPPPSTSSELVDHLVEHLRERLVLFVDALDEMVSERDIHDAIRFLREVSSIAGVSVTVASRWRAPGGDRRVRDLPSQLGVVAGGRRDTLLDLDSDRYFDSGDLLAYAEAVLCQEGALRPGPRRAAWEEYRRDPGLRRRVAEAITLRADRNYLVAAMAALHLSESDESVDPGSPGFDERRDLPATVGGALDKYLDRLPAGRRQRTVALLVALAYAEGSGLTDDRWRAFTEALGYARPSQEDLDALRGGGAADYLLQTTAAGTERTTRLFHQALADHLRETRDARTDQRHLAARLVGELPEGDWSRAPEYLREHGPTHLAAGGLLDEHLPNVRFLLAVHPERLMAVLSAARSSRGREAAQVYELAFHQLVTQPAEERPAYLQLAAQCAGQSSLAAAMADAVRSSPWSVSWVHWRPPRTHRLVGRHRGGVRSLVVSELAGEPVVVSGGDKGGIQVWRLNDGAVIGAPWHGHDGGVWAMVLGELAGEPVVVSGGEDGTVRVWRLNGGVTVGEPFRGHAGGIGSVAQGHLNCDPVVISGGADGTVRVWRLEDGSPVGEPLRGHTGWVWSVALGKLGGHPVIVSGGEDGTLRVWRLDGGTQVNAWISHQGPVDAVAVGEFDGCPVVVSGGRDGTVRVWRLDDGSPVGEPWHGHASDRGGGGGINAVAVGEFEGHQAVVSGGVDGTVRVRRLDGGTPLGEPWRGHDWVDAVALGQLDGRPVVVSGGSVDGTVRLWQLGGDAPGGQPWRGHEGWITAVAVGAVDRRPVVVSGGEDGTVRVWELDTGVPVGGPCGHDGAVRALAVGALKGRPAVAALSTDGTVRVWRLDDGSPVGELWSGDGSPGGALAVRDLGGEPVVVCGSQDGTVEVRRLDGGTGIGNPCHGHEGDVGAVALGDVGGEPLLVCGSRHGMVRAWRLADGSPIGEPWRGHESGVRALAVGGLAGGLSVASGDREGRLRVWRLEGGALLDAWIGHDGTVEAVAMGQLAGGPVVVSGGSNGTVAVWHPAHGGKLQVIDLGSTVWALALARPHRIVVGTAMGLVVLQIASAGPGLAGR